MRTTLNYTAIKLNNASTATPSGSTEPVTSIQIPTGTNSGDFVELTDAQALAVSATATGTLYGGVYMRVKMTSTLTGIAIGQALFWNRTDTSDPYAVTNVPSSTQYDFAGVYIDKTLTAGNYVWIQLTGRATVLVNGNGAVGDFAQFPITSTNQFVVSTGTAPTTPNFAGIQMAAGTGGAGSLVLVDLRIAQARY